MEDSDELLERARAVECCRCKGVVVDEPSRAGTVMANYYIPTLGVRRRVVLCGACGLAFQEFLHPEVLDDPGYAQGVALLRSMWG